MTMTVIITTGSNNNEKIILQCYYNATDLDKCQSIILE